MGYQNRLVQVGDGGSAAPSSGQSANYLWDYDYRTRRVKRAKVPQTTGAAVEQVNFVFSGDQSVKELFGGSWTQDLTYIRGSDWGGGVGGILYVRQASNSYYNHYNNRGDIILQTQRYGSETFQAQYEGFGTRTAQSGTKRGRQGANTKDEETELGLLNEGFRYRDLETGAFLSRDPAGFIDGPNLYAYVSGNPWSAFDPEGLFKVGQFLDDVGGFANSVKENWKDDLGNGLRGFGDAAKAAGEGLKDLAVSAVNDPLGTASAIGAEIVDSFDYAGKYWGQVSVDPKTFTNDISEAFSKAFKDPATAAYSIGQMAFAAEAAVVGHGALKGVPKTRAKAPANRKKSFAVEKANKKRPLVAGVTEKNGDITIYKDGVRSYAKDAGTSVRHELRTTVFHESWHQGSLKIRASISRLLPQGHLRNKAWEILGKVDEPLAEAYGQSRAILRDFKRPTGDPTSRRFHFHE